MTNHHSKLIILGATALISAISYAVYKYSTSSSAPTSTTTTKTPQKETKPRLREIYSNKQFGIEFEYPLGYKIEEQQPVHNTFRIIIKPDSGSSSYMVCVEEQAESIILKKYIAESIRKVEEVPGFVLVSKKELSKHKAELIYDHKSTQHTTRYYNIMEVRDNVVYLITYEKQLDSPDDSYFNELLKSFKIFPVEKYGVLYVTSDKYGLNMKLPSTKFRSRRTNDVLDVVRVDEDKKITQRILILTVDEKNIDSIIEKRKAEKKNFSQIDKSFVVAGSPAKCYSYSDVIDGASVLCNECYFTANDVSFICTAFVRDDFKDEMSKLLESIQSIKLNKKGISFEKGFLNYENTKYKCSLEIPQYSFVTEFISTSECIATFILSSEDAIPEGFSGVEHILSVKNASDLPEDIKTTDELKEFISQQITDEGGEDLVMLKEDILKINGREAIQFVYNYYTEQLDETRTTVLTVIKHGDRLFKLESACLSEDYDAVKNICKNVHNSFIAY